VIGRYTSQIRDGKFTLDDVSFELTKNNRNHHLHGGVIGFDKQVWRAELKDSNGNSSVQMTLNSPHMAEGYPGNVEVTVDFALNNVNEISISYCATTDQSTPLSLTNHTYFNLSGFTDTIGNHIAQIDSKNSLLFDQSNIPNGEIEDVSGKVMDLRQGRLLGDCLKLLESGFDHYYIFDKAENTLKKVASFVDIISGTKLDVSTTEPGAIFYTGYYTSDELQRESGAQYGRFRGLCFETCRYPNGPNIPNSPNSITHPHEEYQSTTIFKISDSPTVKNDVLD